ncbi:MAG TPA: GGDEF domain-containing protein [Nannocystis sp.]
MPTPTAVDFEASLLPRNASALRIEVRLGVMLVPAFWALDWVVLPERIWLLLWIRAVPTTFGLVILLLSRWAPGWFERHANALAFTFSLMVACSIILMCFLHQGYESAYYAGVNLLILGVGLLFSWRAVTAILFNAAVYACYMAPLALGLVTISDFPIALTNQFFLVATAIITVASMSHRRGLERREFDAQIAQQNLLAEVQTMATIDWLTNLYNRRHFFRLGEEEIARARRYRHPISVIMIDIDHFKSVNDTHGHSVGDEVLCTIAKRILAGLRQSDIAGRYGGEEFAIVLPETDLPSAANIVAERLRDTIAAHAVHTAEGPLHITISVGVAGVDLERENLLDALSRADAGLYAAKHAGRNRVIVWTPELARPASESLSLIVAEPAPQVLVS